MYILNHFLFVTHLSIRTLATPIAQKVLSITAGTPQAFCAVTTDCDKINLDTAIPERIDIGAYIHGFKEHCQRSAHSTTLFCYVDIATEQSCQIGLGWYGDLARFKGAPTMKGSIIANMAKAHLGGGSPRRYCAGGVETVSNPFGTLVVGVKAFGRPLL